MLDSVDGQTVRETSSAIQACQNGHTVERRSTAPIDAGDEETDKSLGLSKRASSEAESRSGEGKRKSANNIYDFNFKLRQQLALKLNL